MKKYPRDITLEAFIGSRRDSQEISQMIQHQNAVIKRLELSILDCYINSIGNAFANFDESSSDEDGADRQIIDFFLNEWGSLE